MEIWEFFPKNTVKHTSLKVNQSTPIKEANKQLAEAIERSTSNAVAELAGIAPANNGMNTCTFLCLVAAQKIFNAKHKEEINGNWPKMVPEKF